MFPNMINQEQRINFRKPLSARHSRSGGKHLSTSTHIWEPANHPRTLILVDAENLIGSPVFSVAQAKALRPRVEFAAGYRPGDVVVIASSHKSAGELWLGWGDGPRRLVRSGPDGADLKLLGVLEVEAPHERFDRVVIASGDGIFATECARLQFYGCEVTVVAADENSLSRALRLATLDVRLLDSPRDNVTTDYATGPAA